MKRISNIEILQKICSKITEEDAKRVLEHFTIEEKTLSIGKVFVQDGQAFLVSNDTSKTLGVIKSVSYICDNVSDEFTVEIPDLPETTTSSKIEVTKSVEKTTKKKKSDVTISIEKPKVEAKKDLKD